MVLTPPASVRPERPAWAEMNENLTRNLKKEYEAYKVHLFSRALSLLSLILLCLSPSFSYSPSPAFPIYLSLFSLFPFPGPAAAFLLFTIDQPFGPLLHCLSFSESFFFCACCFC